MKTAIVLGGTYPHRLLINKLKNRGYYTILIDYYENPIAKEVADRHIQESTLDKDRVLEIAKREKASLVISSCVDQANVTACYVAEQLGLPHPYSYNTSLCVTDKQLMKQIMMRDGIPTSHYYSINSLNEFDPDRLNFPLIVKPADSNSSKGVRRFDAFNAQSTEYILQALKLSRNGAAIIEEYKKGKEVGVDCIIKNHKPIIVMTRERRKIKSNIDSIQQIYGSFWPASISPRQMDSIRIIAEQIAESFELDNTPLMIQAIVSDNEISVIEFGARIGGGENYRIIKELTGYDIIEQSINSFLNSEISSSFSNPSAKIADNYIYMHAGVFGRMEIDKCVLSDVLYSNVYRRSGSIVGGDISSNNRVGVFVVKADSEFALSEKIKRVVANMEVYNAADLPVMRKDIY